MRVDSRLAPISKERTIIMPFSKEQITYMRSLGLNLDFSNLSDDDWITLEDVVADRLMYAGFHVEGEEYIANDEGLMCESILDLLP